MKHIVDFVQKETSSVCETSSKVLIFGILRHGLGRIGQITEKMVRITDRGLLMKK